MSHQLNYAFFLDIHHKMVATQAFVSLNQRVDLLSLLEYLYNRSEHDSQ